MNRRNFIFRAVQATAGLSLLNMYGCDRSESSLFFKISLAQWSLHRALKGGRINHLEFAVKSREFGCEGLEYVNQFFKDKANNMAYLKEMNAVADSEGQKNVLIMIDGEGSMADTDVKQRLKAVENHYKWVDAAYVLGCHAIRVNLAGGKDENEAVKSGVDSLNKLSEYAKGSGINVLVENHGGFSSNGTWMKKVFSQVENENCGTLPDFGNFCIAKENKVCVDEYDRYQGVADLLPFAKAVSAKSRSFDAEGNETETDYYKVMKMVKESGYKGFVGIEYEGSSVGEEEGIKLTRDLLIKVGKQLL